MKAEIETISPLDTSFSFRNSSYTSSFSTCASVSSSVWSDASQGSIDTTISSQSSNPDFSAHTKPTSPWSHKNQLRLAVDVVAPELRQNPRRTSQGSVSRSGCPPKLVHQNDRKVNFVDNLVDSAALIVEAIWPLSSAPCRSDTGSKAGLSLRSFIQETLKRSRTSYSTLQVTMYYLILIKDHVPKQDLSTEQPHEVHENRALQCGRRVFLAALILASKYLQDRNYSARAWSKISGLNTNEINQNEMAFLLAVNWNLHITDPIWQRWTKILLNYRPPPPPSPGFGLSRFCSRSHEWKKAIMKLGADLVNIEDLVPFARCAAPVVRDLSISPSTSPSPGLGFDANELPPLTPTVMEPPTPSSVHTPGRLVPALGLLPTPKLTPQQSGFCTPAASVGAQSLGKNSAMCLAMAHAGSASATQFLDRLPASMPSTSPQGYFGARRSSLANSVSTASSPESMISDVSRSSRASSISSASSLGSATMSCRYRNAKLGADRPSLRPIIAPVPEDHAETFFTCSPESYVTGPVGKLGSLSLDTPLARQQRSLEDMTRELQAPVNDAARTLSALRSETCSPMSIASTPVAKIGTKRSRTSLTENNPLQESVRDILTGRLADSAWPDTLVRSQTSVTGAYLQVPTSHDWRSNKRVCCSTEASADVGPSLMHPSMALGGFGRPGMWDGILHD